MRRQVHEHATDTSAERRPSLSCTDRDVGGDCARLVPYGRRSDARAPLPWRQAEGVPCGTDVLTPTYAFATDPSISFESSTRWPPSRSCRSVPRGGVVNARRPGRRPGRSEAKSIDDAEPGASIESAMVRGADLESGSAKFRREQTCVCARGFLANHRLSCSVRCGHEHVHARRAFSRHDLCAQTWTCGTATDGVNDPVSTGWGHSPVRTRGSFTPSFVQRLQQLHLP